MKLEYFKTRNINCLLNSKMFNSPNKFRSSFFYSINVMKNLDLSDYDIVLSSSASVAKYVKAPNGKHFHIATIQQEQFGKQISTSVNQY